MKEGAKIVSSKAFCPLNFRITDRNLSGKQLFNEILLTMFKKVDMLLIFKFGTSYCQLC